MPNPLPSLGRATSIGPPKGLWERARSKVQRYTPDWLDSAIQNTLKLGEIQGLNDPSGAYANASIPALRASKEVAENPQLRKWLDYAMKRWPRATKATMGGTSMLDEIDRSTSGSVGKYWDNNDNLIVFKKNPATGQPLDMVEVLKSIAHEQAHRVQNIRSQRLKPFERYYKKLQAAAMPHERRPREIQAYGVEDALEKHYRKRGLIE